MNRRVAVVGAAVAVALLAGVTVAVRWDGEPKQVVVGKTSTETSSPPPEAVVPSPPDTEPPPPPAEAPPVGGGPEVGVKPATGRPFGPAIEFRSNIPVRSDLTFILVIGSDARPREDVRTARADSVHLLAVNPATGRGTVVGIPRDAYVEIPGRGRGKITDSLTQGGPRLVADTVRRLSGLPVHYYVLTGFAGLSAMVDALGGVDVHVDQRMNDRASGARFERGWHHFSGAEALAYTRDRHSVPNGDFGRSLNHGNLILATLGKMRSEVGDDAGLLHWVGVLTRHVELDVPRDEIPRLGALARRLDPTHMTNLVVPGRIGWAGRASVVYLTEGAMRIFADLRDDAVMGGAPPPPPSTTTSTTATTIPPPTPPPPPTTQPPPTTYPPTTLLPR